MFLRYIWKDSNGIDHYLSNSNKTKKNWDLEN